MRDVLEQGLAWAVVVGIILGVILGRRRGREARSAAIATAVAQARQDWEAQLAAVASATVTNNVAVDASLLRSLGGAHDPASCVDPFSCAVCGPVARILTGRGDATGDDRAIGYYYDNARRSDYYDQLDDPRVGAVPVERRRTREVDGRVGHGLDRAGVLRVDPSQTGE
jgi:hypothetical protein